MFTRRQWLLGLGFVAALSVLIVFSVRAAHHARALHPKVDEPIQGWMDLRYIAHSYHVPPYVLADALKLPPGPGGPPPPCHTAAISSLAPMTACHSSQRYMS